MQAHTSLIISPQNTFFLPTMLASLELSFIMVLRPPPKMMVIWCIDLKGVGVR